MECKRCQLHLYRKHIVQGRGSIPAKILFIGEAPGRSEDLRGLPFIGPSGRVLDMAMRDAERMISKPFPSYYITNTVFCRPCDSKNGPNRAPLEAEVMACWDNLDKVYGMIKPLMVILLGKVAEHYCHRIFPWAKTLYHPAYILRRGGIGGPEYDRFVRELAVIIEQMD